MTQFQDLGFESLAKIPVPGIAPVPASAIIPEMVPVAPIAVPEVKVSAQESKVGNGYGGLILILLLFLGVWGVSYMARKNALSNDSESDMDYFKKSR